MVSSLQRGASVITSEFFDLVLPGEGLRVVALLAPERWRGMRHKFLTSNELAAAFVRQTDRDPVQVFFACASYVTPDGGRKGDNVQAVRSFWLDIDCGEGKPYTTPQHALAAVREFCREVGLPFPLLVSSGSGIHAYWPMSADMRPAEWEAVALLLKEATKRWGLEVDQSRTADKASVLRPPGSTHRKGAEIEVSILRTAGPFALPSFCSALETFLGFSAHVEEDMLGPRPSHIDSPVTALVDKTPFLPAYADRVADQCGVMGMIRDTKGQTDQPTWFHGIQLLNKCEDGKDLAHEWSKGDKRYQPSQVNDILARVADRGPTSCKKFGDLQPAICGACPHNGKLTSPISLGVAPAVPAVITTVAKSTSPFGDSTPEEVVIQLPFQYAWQRLPNHPHQQLCFLRQEDDESITPVPFCNTLFYPVERLGSETDGASVEVEVRQRNDGRKRFILKTSTIAKGGDALASALGEHEIMAMPRHKPTVEGYLSAWIDVISKDRDAVMARSRFGWFGTSFLIGPTLLQPGGSSASAALQDIALHKQGALVPAGTLEEWSRVIDTAYNAPGQEAFQFMVLNGFAAPLFSMFKQFGGITVYAHSDGTGVGKTTAQRAALSVFGNWQEMQLADGKVTENVLWGLMGAYGNLPVMMDELTNQTNAAASNIVFSVSSGRAKERMTSAGGLRTNNANWSTILMASGNALISDKIGQHRGNSAAELARLFEFTIDVTSHLTPNDAAKLFPRLLDNYGHAGHAFMRYVVDNYDKVNAMMELIQASLNDEAGIKQEERYWSALITSVLTAQLICRKLGLLGFEVAPLKAWMLHQLNCNRTSQAANVANPVDLFNTMLADLWPGIIVTYGEGDLRKGNIALLAGAPPVGMLNGRAIIPQLVGEVHMLAISVASVKGWCNKHNVSSSAMFNALVKEGFALPDVRKYAIGRGTEKYASVSSQVRCWILDPEKMGVDLTQPATVNNSKSAGRKAHVRLV